MSGVYRIAGERLLIAVKAAPGASKTCIAGIHGNSLRVKIAAAPEGGKANAELCSFMAALLGCAKKDVSLEHGGKSRLKTLAVPLACREALDSLVKGQN